MPKRVMVKEMLLLLNYTSDKSIQKAFTDMYAELEGHREKIEYLEQKVVTTKN